MSELDRLWKHENSQHELVPPKTECGYPSGGGNKNGHIIMLPLIWRNAERKKESYKYMKKFLVSWSRPVLWRKCYPPARNESHCYSFTFWLQPLSQRRCHIYIIYISILAFQLNQFLQSFLYQNNTLVTNTKSVQVLLVSVKNNQPFN